MPTVASTIRSTRESSGFSSYRFPLDLGPTGMVFNFYKYSYAGAGAGTGFSSRARMASSIVLPLPVNLENSYGVEISSAELGPLGALAAGALSAADSGNLGGTFASGGAAFQQGLSATENLGSSIAQGDYSGVVDFMRGASFFSRNAIDGLFPGAGLALDAGTGTTVNPQQTLAFQGVKLKNFSFNWQLAPRNAGESDALRQIERKIKQHILPSYQGASDTNSALDRAFLGYPDLCQIYFKGIDPKFYFEFKPGMVSDFSVNYSPNGNVVLEGGRPAIVNVRMTFQEARIHTREDYGGTSAGGTTSAQPEPTPTADTTSTIPPISGPDDGLRG